MKPDALSPLDIALQDANGNLSPQFFTLFLSCEIFVLADGSPDAPAPQLFETSDGPIILGFDRAERLAGFTKGASAHLVLTGRQLLGVLSAHSWGLGLNFEQSPYPVSIPLSAIEWLQHQPLGAQETSAGLDQISPPNGVHPSMLQRLDQQLALLGGMARSAYLVQTQPNHLLVAIVAPSAGCEGAIKTALSEFAALSGDQSTIFDIMFVNPQDPICAKLARVGLRFELPQR